MRGPSVRVLPVAPRAALQSAAAHLPVGQWLGPAAAVAEVVAEVAVPGSRQFVNRRGESRSARPRAEARSTPVPVCRAGRWLNPGRLAPPRGHSQVFELQRRNGTHRVCPSLPRRSVLWPEQRQIECCIRSSTTRCAVQGSRGCRQRRVGHGFCGSRPYCLLNSVSRLS